jgi:chemotaxis signal transduction protein
VYERVALVEAGGERYALAVAHVREIVRATPIAPLPDLPAFMLGICAVRGELVSVVELAELRGHGRTGESELLAIIEVSGRVVGLLFTSLLGLRDIFEDELALADEGLTPAFIRAITKDGTSLLALDRLLASESLLVGRREHRSVEDEP